MAQARNAGPRRARAAVQARGGGAPAWLKAVSCVALAAGAVGPSAARDFGEHERPWARDVAQDPLQLGGECPAYATQFGRAQIEGGLAPPLDPRFDVGERALALAQARSARLDAQEARIAAAQATLDAAAADVQEHMRALQALQRSILREIDRLDGLEGAAEAQRVDVLRALRPRDAAGVLANTPMAESAQLLAALQPREAAAILKEMPPKKAEALFDTMRAGAEPAADPQPSKQERALRR